MTATSAAAVSTATDGSDIWDAPTTLPAIVTPAREVTRGVPSVDTTCALVTRWRGPMANADPVFTLPQPSANTFQIESPYRLDKSAAE